MTPAEAGEVTEYQFVELYLKPALERNRRAGGESGRRGRPVRVKSRPPTRDEYVRGGVALGGDADAMSASYDRIAAAQGWPTGRE